MKRVSITTLTLIVLATSLNAAEFHVSITGKDTDTGAASAPFRTIQHAADLAQPGDVITVHAGIYRERINPPRGGESDAKRITYQAAQGEKVVITGAESIKGWTKVTNDTWSVTIPNTFFGAFNPYTDRIRGDWFNSKKREHHTGAVYLNGDWLTEAAKLAEVLKPVSKNPFWFGTVGAENTTIQAQFKGVDPNEANVEINVRQTVFTPKAIGINYLTVRGFDLRNAATPWAPPTAGQIGLITAYWCKGWIIEDNHIAYSTCSGVALGKYSDTFDNKSANSAEGYVATVKRAQAHTLPWTKEHIGHHIVRNNHISNCEQTGIVGSLGCSFSTVTNNEIHDIHMRQLFTGAEMAGIKFHGAIDTLISRNHIYRTNRGIWLDWMAQGARVSGNLLHDNDTDQDLYMEVNHGPYIVDNNLFLSRWNFWDMSEGGAFVHNLFAGKIVTQPDRGRMTPFHLAHSTEIAGITNIVTRDYRFLNNIFIGNGTPGGEGPAGWGSQHLPRGAGYGLWVYDSRVAQLRAAGNVYYNGAQPCGTEAGPLMFATHNPAVKLEQKDGQFDLYCNLGTQLKDAITLSVTTDSLGKATIPNLPFENPDGSPVKIDIDYFGKTRQGANPFPGPFSAAPQTDIAVRVWPR